MHDVQFFELVVAGKKQELREDAMCEITDSQKQMVLSKVGTSSIERAIHKEGMLVSGDPMTVNWKNVKNWAKREGCVCRVPWFVLYVIVIDQLVALIHEDIERQKKFAYFEAGEEAGKAEEALKNAGNKDEKQQL